MSVKWIAQRMLEPDDVNSATEQEGERWGQPEPESANKGALRPAIAGEAADFVYSGTATADGAGDGSTLIDSVLGAYGDDYLIGAIVLITSGACNGQSRTVSDFAQATGTLTVSSAFSAQIVTGVTFTLTLQFATRNFRIELTGSGDTGAATFKWSHDGGTTYFGRNSPNQADWLNRQIAASAYSVATQSRLLDLGEGRSLLFFSDASGDIVCHETTDNGLTWSYKSTLQTASNLGVVLRLPSGRILAFANLYRHCSDDNGSTWAERTYVGYYFEGMAQIGGQLIGVYTVSSAVYCRISADQGLTWSAAVTIAADANSQEDPDICLAADGSLVCVYHSDQDTLNQYKIKAKTSTDNGATWSAVIAVINYTTNVLHPKICRDLNGDLYCVADRNDADMPIIMSRSTDNGLTWSTGSILAIISLAGHDYWWPDVKLIAGQLWAIAYESAENKIVMARRGIWEAYSANAAPCAPDLVEQPLACEASLAWYGGAGITGDIWTFGPEYDFSKENLIEDSPSRPWRSKQDNVACDIVIDMGAARRIYADGVAIFGANLRTLNLQMNDTDSWGSPSVDEAISFDLATGGALDEDSAANELKDTSLLSGYKDHELKGRYLRFTSGYLSGDTFKVLDNVEDYIFCDGDTSSAATGDTFVVFQDHMSHFFTGGTYRYARISIDAQKTAQGYYRLGTMLLGRSVTLSDGFEADYRENHDYDVEVQRTPSGALISIEGADTKRHFSLSWAKSDAGRRQIAALLEAVQGGNVCLVLDDSQLEKTYLLKRISDVEIVWYMGELADLRVEFDEAL